MESWFQRTAGDEERVVCIEGRIRRTESNGYRTESEALLHGEMALADFMAFKRKIQRVSLEENPADQVKALLDQGVSPEILLFHHTMREVPVGIRRGVDPGSYALDRMKENKFILEAATSKEITLDDAVRQFNSTLLEKYEHKIAPQSFEHGEDGTAKIYPFNSGDERWILHEQSDILLNPDPGRALTPLEEVSLIVHKRREEYAIETLGKHLEKGEACLALYGQPHAPYIVPRIPHFAASETQPLTL
jgi:hypothetical protein